MPGDADEPDVRAIKRDGLGFPLDPGERWKHLAARNAFMDAMQQFFVGWQVRADGVSR